MCGAFCVMYDAVIVLALLGESTVWSYAGAFKLVPYTRLKGSVLVNWGYRRDNSPPNSMLACLACAGVIWLAGGLATMIWDSADKLMNKITSNTRKFI